MRARALLIEGIRPCLVAGVLLTLTLARVGSAQQGQAQARGKVDSATSDAALARPFACGLSTNRLVEGWKPVTVTLVTSWVPGENSKGMLRYKLAAFPTENLNPTDNTTPNAGAPESESIEELMTGVGKCRIFLELYDADGFLLRKFEVYLNRGVDEQGRLHSLVTNDSIQMQAQEYRQFVGAVKRVAEGRVTLPDGWPLESWKISWVCGKR